MIKFVKLVLIVMTAGTCIPGNSALGQIVLGDGTLTVGSSIPVTGFDGSYTADPSNGVSLTNTGDTFTVGEIGVGNQVTFSEIIGVSAAEVQDVNFADLLRGGLINSSTASSLSPAHDGDPLIFFQNNSGGANADWNNHFYENYNSANDTSTYPIAGNPAYTTPSGQAYTAFDGDVNSPPPTIQAPANSSTNGTLTQFIATVLGTGRVTLTLNYINPQNGQLISSETISNLGDKTLDPGLALAPTFRTSASGNVVPDGFTVGDATLSYTAVTVTPEPATGWLLLLGIGGLVLVRRLRVRFS